MGFTKGRGGNGTLKEKLNFRFQRGETGKEKGEGRGTEYREFVHNTTGQGVNGVFVQSMWGKKGMGEEENNRGVEEKPDQERGEGGCGANDRKRET